MIINFGIIGAPNAGKSTIFSKLTSTDIAIHSKPFTTTHPNKSTIEFIDERLKKLVQIFPESQLMPILANFSDLAAIADGASKGEGLGNQFLAYLKKADLIIHLLNCHNSPPKKTIDEFRYVENELRLADLLCVTESLEVIEELIKRSGRDSLSSHQKKSIPLLKDLQEYLKTDGPTEKYHFDEEDLKTVRPYKLLTLLPKCYLLNFSSEIDDDTVDIMRASLPSKQHNLLLSSSHSISSEELQYSLVCTGLQLLEHRTFYTINSSSAHAWLCPTGSNITGAARSINADLADQLKSARVINFAEIKTFSLDAIMSQTQEQKKDYEIKDGDLIFFET